MHVTCNLIVDLLYFHGWNAVDMATSLKKMPYAGSKFQLKSLLSIE
jgi:hypothetical protein